LLNNWATILFKNNRDIDRLNDVPLTHSEMQQIIEQIRDLKTPLKLNSFINGKTVAITRDNPDDALHMGRTRGRRSRRGLGENVILCDYLPYMAMSAESDNWLSGYV